MKTQQVVQELKSERVQEELALEEPFWLSLKSERVQEPALAQAGAGANTSSCAYELSLNQTRSMTIELTDPQVFITIFEPGGPKRDA